ncbi:MAG: hypothetical protein AB4911_02175 [Oscillochloridaceae bacterium umkhey_bin13]
MSDENAAAQHQGVSRMTGPLRSNGCPFGLNRRGAGSDACTTPCVMARCVAAIDQTEELSPEQRTALQHALVERAKRRACTQVAPHGATQEAA